MNIAVVPVFGAHVVCVVAGGEAAKILEKLLSGGRVGFGEGLGFFEDLGAERVEGRHGFVLEFVAHPGGEVALGVGPGNSPGEGKLANGF